MSDSIHFAVLDPEGNEIERHPTPQAALEVSQRMNKAYAERDLPQRTRIKKVSGYTTEQVSQEALRVRRNLRHDGERMTVPWERESWWVGMQSSEQPHHVAHAKFGSDRIHFATDHEHLFGGTWNTLSVGAYLNRYALDGDGSPYWADCEVQDYALQLSNATAERTLYFAETGDEIVSVYKRGPRSCMSFPHDDHDGSTHPCEVYGYDDELKLAYFTDDDTKDGKPKARALVYQGCSIRTYGDIDRLDALLDAAGIASGGSLEGCTLDRIEEDGGLVLPYLDSVCSVTDHGCHLEVTYSGDIDATSTGGVVYDRPRCAHCGERCDEYDMTTAEDSYEQYCTDCAQYCESCGYSYSPDQTMTHIHDEHAYWCEDCTANDAAECEGCWEHRTNDATVVSEQGTAYCEDCAAEHTCTDCGVVDEYDVDEHGDDDEHRCSTCHAEAHEDDDDESEDSA